MIVLTAIFILNVFFQPALMTHETKSIVNYMLEFGSRTTDCHDNQRTLSFFSFFQSENRSQGGPHTQRTLHKERHPRGLGELLLHPAQDQSLRHGQDQRCRRYVP